MRIKTQDDIAQRVFKLVQWFSSFNVDFEQVFAYFRDFQIKVLKKNKIVLKGYWTGKHWKTKGFLRPSIFTYTTSLRRRGSICGALHDLVPSVQFKNVTNTHGRVLILVKLQAEQSCRLQPVTLLKLTLLHRCFSHFFNCTNGTKSRNAPHISNFACFIFF